MSSFTLSTTPRRKLRESSLGSTDAEGEVDDAGERRRRDARERDEREDAAARRTLSDTPDPSRHDRAAEAESGECPPAPAYRCGSAQCYDKCRHNQRDEVGRARQQSNGCVACPGPIPSETDSEREDVEDDREPEHSIRGVEADAVFSCFCGDCRRRHGATTLRGGDRCDSLGSQAETTLTLESPHSGVNFPMAVRAEHHALKEFRCDRLPGTAQTVP